MVLNLDKLWFQSICNLLSLNYVVGRIMVLATWITRRVSFQQQRNGRYYQCRTGALAG